MIYALDSSIIIYLLNRNEMVCTKRDEVIAAGERIIIPPIVDYEIRRGFLYKSFPKKESIYWSICGHYGIGDMTAEIWMRSANIYADLRKRSISIEDADIFIAAFCVVNDYILVTHNIKHFENINVLRIEDWLI
jgi:predicted nucleic acid-binding protein